MELQLPIPIFSENDTYTHLEVVKPTGLILANTHDVIQSSGEYMGLRNLISGCASRIYSADRDIQDPVSKKSMVFTIPNKSAEYVVLQLMIAFYNGEDYVGGVYNCPMCETLSIARRTEEIDTRDRISELPVTFMEDPVKELDIQLEKPSIINVGGLEMSVENLTLEIPTLGHHHKAFLRHGNTNSIRFQLGVYAEAIKTVNGNSIEDKWRNSHGIRIFENMPEIKTDTDKISSVINRYGTDLRVTKRCTKCGEVWRPVINTSNFFGSALQFQRTDI